MKPLDSGVSVDGKRADTQKMNSNNSQSGCCLYAYKMILVCIAGVESAPMKKLRGVFRRQLNGCNYQYLKNSIFEMGLRTQQCTNEKLSFNMFKDPLGLISVMLARLIK